MQRLSALAAVILSLFAVTAPAYGQGSSARDGYGGKQNVQSDVLGEVGTVEESQPSGGGGTQPAGAANAPENSSGPATPASTEAAPVASNALPFTGFDVALMLVGGLALIGMGFGVRRLAAPRV